MAKSGSSKKAQPTRKVSGTQIVLIVISVIVILSYTMSLVLK